MRGEDPDKIEKENLKLRHDKMRDVERVKANIRVLLIIVMFACIYSFRARLQCSHPVNPPSRLLNQIILNFCSKSRYRG